MPRQVEAFDDFSRCMADRVTEDTEWRNVNLFSWWSRDLYSDLTQWATDVLSIPTTSAELELIVNLAKRIWTDYHNCLAPEAFKATLSFLHWEMQKLYIISH
jgi:hypothetical protein